MMEMRASRTTRVRTPATQSRRVARRPVSRTSVPLLLLLLLPLLLITSQTVCGQTRAAVQSTLTGTGVRADAAPSPLPAASRAGRWLPVDQDPDRRRIATRRAVRLAADSETMPEIIAPPLAQFTIPSRSTSIAAQQLQRQIEELHRERQLAYQETRESADPFGERPRTIRRLESELAHTDLLQDRQLERIKLKLGQLQSIAGSRACPAEPPAGTEEDAASLPDSRDLPPTRPTASLVDSALAERATEANASAAQEGPAVDDSQPDAGGIEPMFSPRPVTDDVVDRMKFADNLFASGKVNLALEIYGKVLLDATTDEDRVWVQYQIACCHRQLGKISEAEKIYRMLANSEQNKYWAANARWWLKTLGSSQRVQQRQAQVTTTIHSLQEATDALVTP